MVGIFSVGVVLLNPQDTPMHTHQTRIVNGRYKLHHTIALNLHSHSSRCLPKARVDVVIMSRSEMEQRACHRFWEHTATGDQECQSSPCQIQCLLSSIQTLALTRIQDSMQHSKQVYCRINFYYTVELFMPYEVEKALFTSCYSPTWLLPGTLLSVPKQNNCFLPSIN